MREMELQGEGFRMRVQVHGAYLRAHVFDGVDSLQVSMAMWKLLAELCRAHGVRQLLVIEDLTASVDTGDIGTLVTAMVDFGLADIRIAFVDLQEDIHTNEDAGIQALECNITINNFGQEAQARHWLLYGVDNP